MAKDRPILMAFGDVKAGGRIVVCTNIGDTVALTKITPIHAAGVQNAQKFVLPGAIDSPVCYNALHCDKEGKVSCFYLPDEVHTTFFTDF